MNDASLKRLHKYNKELVKLYKTSKEKQTILECLSFINCFMIRVDYDKQINMFALNRQDFFMLADLLCLLSYFVRWRQWRYYYHKYVNIYEYPYFSRKDILCFRDSVYKTKRATDFIFDLFTELNLSNNDLYIDVFNNRICFNKKAIQSIFEVINSLKLKYDYLLSRININVYKAQINRS